MRRGRGSPRQDVDCSQHVSLGRFGYEADFRWGIGRQTDKGDDVTKDAMIVCTHTCNSKTKERVRDYRQTVVFILMADNPRLITRQRSISITPLRRLDMFKRRNGCCSFVSCFHSYSVGRRDSRVIDEQGPGRFGSATMLFELALR